MTNDTELLPCPFCGGAYAQARPGHQNIAFVVCDNCKAVVSFGGREKMADTIHAYNTRAAIDKAMKEGEE